MFSAQSIPKVYSEDAAAVQLVLSCTVRSYYLAMSSDNLSFVYRDSV
jgi:hypothetical protein